MQYLNAQDRYSPPQIKKTVEQNKTKKQRKHFLSMPTNSLPRNFSQIPNLFALFVARALFGERLRDLGVFPPRSRADRALGDRMCNAEGDLGF